MAQTVTMKGRMLHPPPRPAGKKRLWQVMSGSHMESVFREVRSEDGTTIQVPTGDEVIYRAGDVFESDLPLDEMYNSPALHPSQQKFREVNSDLPPGYAGGMTAEQIESWKREVVAQWKREQEEQLREKIEAEMRFQAQEEDMARKARADVVGMGPGGPSVAPPGTKTAADLQHEQTTPAVGTALVGNPEGGKDKAYVDKTPPAPQPNQGKKR